MNKEKRIREEAQVYLALMDDTAMKLYRIAGYTEDFEASFPNKAWKNLTERVKDKWRMKAEQILSHPSIAIVCDDQSLPDLNDWSKGVDLWCELDSDSAFGEGQQSMLTPDSEGRVWKKVRGK